MSLRTQTMDYIQFREEELNELLKEELKKWKYFLLSPKEVNSKHKVKWIRWELRQIRYLIREWELI